ncbi:MAG: radical SAM protein [Anaerolineales bacterium]|nr:radical SAM protein [Anaerolineales bacterium]MBS3752988.1 radical SAM protein [Anaerolineales bacterium]
MNTFYARLKNLFSPPSLIAPGVYHYQAPPSADEPYRMHLRVEKGGRGLLIINAATVLHLNQTATEYAFYLIQGISDQDVVREVSNRYSTGPDQVQKDYQEFKNKIQTMIEKPDLDPVHYLDLDRKSPYAGAISAPYRMDCALTYRLPEESNPDLAPTRNVDRELITSEWKTILDKAWKAGIPHVSFTGGEPTLREDLVELINHAEEKGQVTGLLSDGFRFADQAFLQEVLLTGLDHLMFVLTPLREDSWAVLQRVLDEDIHTTVHITIHKEFAEHMEDMLKKLKDMGANALSLSVRSPQDPTLKKALSKARSYAAEIGLPLKWDLPVPYSVHNPVSLETKGDDTPRGAGKAWIYVEPDGDVLPTQGGEHIYGNLWEDPWESVWSKAT